MNRKAVIDAIDRLFGDTSRPASATKNDLEYILLHVEQLIETLAADGVESDEE